MTRRARVLLGLTIALPVTLSAQQPAATPVRAAATASLSLNDAIEQARRNSPVFRQALNDAGPANWGVRNAYANFLPTFDVSSSLGYTGSGASTFGGSTFNQSSPSMSSSYSLSFNWRLSGQELAATGQQQASRRATEADITNAGEQLRNDVTTQYLNALQATAQTEVARQQVQRNSDFLELARARYQVGQNTMLDVRQAEVLKGQSDVALLRAQQTENEAKIELFRRMGVTIPGTPETVALPDSFPVTEPQFDQNQLLSLARDENPSLKAFSARERAATWNTRSAKSRFLPTINLSASLNGFTQQFTDENILIGGRIASAQGQAENCRFQNALIGSLPGGAGVPGYPNGGIIADCNAFSNLDATGDALTPEARAQLLERNQVFPFSFTKQPFSARLTISLPIFDGFGRNLQVAQARAQEDDLAESVRATTLLVESNVRSRYLGVINAHRAILVQEQNRQSAREQLRLAQDRYRLGSGSSLEVSDGQNTVTRAEGDYVNAVYEYHKAIAALEFAVGRPLR
ncbi:MAG: TolC family protein [Gemmatimonadales bacterium]|nr:TolC family protein [Gemmatimonadales bacterium]